MAPGSSAGARDAVRLLFYLWECWPLAVDLHAAAQAGVCQNVDRLVLSAHGVEDLRGGFNAQRTHWTKRRIYLTEQTQSGEMDVAWAIESLVMKSIQVNDAKWKEAEMGNKQRSAEALSM